jgi:hypothetical protein
MTSVSTAPPVIAVTSDVIELMLGRAASRVS